MNIDLLLTDRGETGLVADGPFASPVAGVMYDQQTGQMTLEFANMDSLDLNVPIEEEAGAYIAQAYHIHIGVIARGAIADSRQVPLILQNDPFGGGHAGRLAGRPRSSILAFEAFMKRTVAGQPAHRDDLGDEAKAGTVLGGISAAVLQFAPHLARQRTMEAAPHLQNTLEPRIPGMGPGGGGGNAARRVTRRPPRADGEEQE